ncbi:flagellar biosynthesis protein [Clostridium sp. 19966]|uniref:TIGR02530 family flagellar biosynthesis protein n=1 Tax=Clostridium sp. 19966 TaxID=2768166 RepID=UPI0028DF4978|nr:TIGR02530 family flagellar biosynthesis protein [Clostridium sp. 19966]MDT8716650.1 flagellar biosynthesis protein [Clostridium sp. 19966]
MGYRVINGVLYPVGNFPSNNTVVSSKNSDKASFKNVLAEAIEKDNGFTISNHAAERLNGTAFTDSDMKKINEGINKAEEKGCKNCVMLYKDVALVTSIENRTIITAVNGDRRKDNLFTNVDSVLLL